MKLDVRTFVLDCSDKEQACKVLEEAAEVFGSWQYVESVGGAASENDSWGLQNLANEIADVIQAACNLAARYDIDMAAAMERCTKRQRERGRL